MQAVGPAFAQQASPAAPQRLHMPPMPAIAPTQTPPVWQMAPAQQAPPVAPHIWHMRGMPPPGFAQPRPVLQTLPAQHTSPFAPHAMHVCMPAAPWHDRPVSQRLAAPRPTAQHAAPLAPHARHIDAAPAAPATQTAPDAVQVPPFPAALPPQQG